MSDLGMTATVDDSGLGGEWVRWLLDTARGRLGMDIAWVSLFSGDQQLIASATGDLDAMNVREGMSTPLESSFCVRVLSGQLPPVVTGAGRDPRTRDLPVTSDLGIGSYVGAPLLDADSRPLGMLCCLSREPGVQLDHESVRTVELLADLISDHVRQGRAAALGDLPRRRDRLRAYLATGAAVTTYLQPVVDMVDGAVICHEALSRFPGWVDGGPATVFSEALAVGLGVELEERATRAALGAARNAPSAVPIAVNLSPMRCCAPRSSTCCSGAARPRWPSRSPSTAGSTTTRPSWRSPAGCGPRASPSASTTRVPGTPACGTSCG
nr:GAF domain-containing protein [Blastococcus xanthinilyticus]